MEDLESEHMNLSQSISISVSSTDLIPTGFCSQKMWGLIFLALEPWAGGPGV